MKRKSIIILSVILAIILIGIYSFEVIYTKDKFPNNTYVNDLNISGMTFGQADTLLSNTITWKNLYIVADSNKLITVPGKDISYKYISNVELKNVLGTFDSKKWFLYLGKDSKYTIKLTTTYDEIKLKKIITDANILEKTFQNAKLVYSDKNEEYIIEKEIYGMSLSKEELYNLAKKAIDSRQTELNIDKSIKKPEVKADNVTLIKSKDEANSYLKTVITYKFGDVEEIIDKALIKDWLKQNGSKIEFDFEAIRAYEDTIGDKYDTYGKSRDFTTSNKTKIKISGGSYGWTLHRTNSANALIKEIKAGKNKTIEPIYVYTALIRNVNNDIGKSYVEISLSNQKVWVYIDGVLKVETSTVTGNTSNGHATPTGIYPINYKTRNATLKGQGYASPVDYWMPFNGGVGLHDANWRSSFGGNIYKTSGSHGCVNLPPQKAKEIYSLVYPGMPVIVY